MMMKILRSPLFHFMLIGAGLFLLYGWLNRKVPEMDEIIIDDEQVHRSIIIFQREWGRDPGPEELAGLLQNQVRQEVYYRQALKMKLDHNDELIKRRMQQKLSFITHDLANLQEPTEDSLRAYYQRNKTKYQRQALISFTQVYFNPDKRKDPLRDAGDLLRRITVENMSNLNVEQYGDAFSYQQRVDEVSRKALSELMGSAFSDTLFTLTANRWYGPLLSGYGVHLVYIHAIQQAGEADWAKVRDDVLRDYQYAASEQLNEKVYRDFRKQYRVRLNLRDSSTRKYNLEQKLLADEAR